MSANLDGYVTCRQRCLVLQDCVECVCVCTYVIHYTHTNHISLQTHAHTHKTLLSQCSQ